MQEMKGPEEDERTCRWKHQRQCEEMGFELGFKVRSDLDKGSRWKDIPDKVNGRSKGTEAGKDQGCYKLASKAHSVSWPPTANRLILYIDSFAQSNPAKKQDS